MTVSIGIGSNVSISNKIPWTLCIVKKITKRKLFNLRDIFWILTHCRFNNVCHQRQLNLTQFVLVTCSYFKKKFTNPNQTKENIELILELIWKNKIPMEEGSNVFWDCLDCQELMSWNTGWDQSLWLIERLRMNDWKMKQWTNENWIKNGYS